MLVTAILSINTPFPKMIKNREDYIRRKLIKKEFNEVAFNEVKE